MPFVNITVAAEVLTQEQVEALQVGATALMTEVMRKQAELTAVRVQHAPLVAWAVGGKAVACAAHLDVKVSKGTNTAEEKERFIAGAMNLFRIVLGEELNPVAYVVVDEVPGDAWGWDGLTQARRAEASKVAGNELKPAG